MTNLKTYSISLFFNKEGQRDIKNLILEISKITGNNYIVANEVPPHITLGMFKSDNNHIEELISIVEKIAKMSLDIKLKNLEIETFRDKILLLKPDLYATEKLNLLNKELHNRALKNFPAGCNNLYIPENFFPHIAIASGLTNVQMEKGLCYIRKKIKNIEITIERMSLAQRHPYKVIF